MKLGLDSVIPRVWAIAHLNKIGIAPTEKNSEECMESFRKIAEEEAKFCGGCGREFDMSYEYDEGENEVQPCKATPCEIIEAKNAERDAICDIISEILSDKTAKKIIDRIHGMKI